MTWFFLSFSVFFGRLYIRRCKANETKIKQNEILSLMGENLLGGEDMPITDELIGGERGNNSSLNGNQNSDTLSNGNTGSGFADENNSQIDANAFDYVDNKMASESDPLQPKMTKSKSGHKLKEAREVSKADRTRTIREIRKKI